MNKHTNWSDRERLSRKMYGPPITTRTIEAYLNESYPEAISVLLGAIAQSRLIFHGEYELPQETEPDKGPSMDEILASFDLRNGPERFRFLNGLKAKPDYLELLLGETYGIAKQYGLVDNYSGIPEKRKDIFKSLAYSIHANSIPATRTLIELFGIESIPSIVSGGIESIPGINERYIHTEIGSQTGKQQSLVPVEEFDVLKSMFGNKLGSKRGIDHMHMMGYQSLQINGSPLLFYNPGK